MNDIKSQYKIIAKENVDKCPICLFAGQTFLFKDFEGTKFVSCQKCDLVFQNPRHELSYNKDYWGQIIDLDGTKRDLISERNSKIKHLYSDDIKYIENLPGGKILDAGCRFGFFLSAFSDKWDKYGLELSKYCIDNLVQMFPEFTV